MEGEQHVLDVFISRIKKDKGIIKRTYKDLEKRFDERLNHKKIKQYSLIR
jgi:hypothetical protein